jgi:hypothetical protein
MIAFRFEDELPYRKIAGAMGNLHSDKAIRRVCLYYLKFSKIPAQNSHKRPMQQEKTTLGRYEKKALWQLLDDDPSLFLDEAATFLNISTGSSYSKHLISRALVELDLTSKNVRYATITKQTLSPLG